ncbi:MAG: cell division protein FtsX [Chroococcales cyanobacterium]
MPTLHTRNARYCMIKAITRFFNKLDYLLQETMFGLRRGGAMNWAAVSTVTVLLFLFGICLQTSWQLDSLLNSLGSQLEVSVYLQPDTNASEMLPIVKEIPSVKDVRAISRDEAWESLLTELSVSDLPQVTYQLDGNPLVDELKVKVDNADAISSVIEALQAFSEVDEVIYVSEARTRLQQLRKGLNWVSLALTAGLSLTAIAVISTTLHLIAIARRQEIEILQLVGATSTWINLPFMLQGIIFGIIGGAIAWLLISSIRYGLSSVLTTQPNFIQFMTEGLQLNTTQLLLLPSLILALGAFVGFIGSLFALRRISA